MTEPWQIWIDTGGTFTDCLALDPEGRLRRAKVLSSSALRGRVREVLGKRRLSLAGGWEVPPGFFDRCTFHLLEGGGEGVPVAAFDARSATLELAAGVPPATAPGSSLEIRSPEEAPVLAARLVTGTPAGRPLPPAALRLATTRGTNALLERRGAAVALFITRGFADLLAIGTQQRPDLFALDIEKPEPFYAAVVEVDERLAADGSVLVPLRLDAVRQAARELAASGIEAAAVALLHSYRNPAHEAAVAEALREAGLRHVAASAALAPLIQLLPRAETAVVEAYLAPVVGTYLERVRGALEGASDAPRSSLHVMTSAGGLVRAGEFRAADSLLSGPAGGVVGAALAARRSGFPRLIAFDMGGTSTDVARCDGDFEYLFEHRVGDAHLVAPALAIESVAAGGGSVASFDGHRLRVGPESAGAHPGPACYGAGGPLTLTDANLLLGRLDAAGFGIPIDPQAARRAASELAGRLAAAGRGGPSAGEEELLEGLLAIADERMADAIREISVRRGYDPAGYALVAFGGAGAQHACAVAELLGIAAVLVPEDAGLLSARGLGAAVVERFAHRQVLSPLDEVAGELDDLVGELERQALGAVLREGVAGSEAVVRRRLLALRFVGQDSSVTVELEPGCSIPEAFAAAYQERYGYRPEGRLVELESVRVVASGRSPEVEAAGPVEVGGAVGGRPARPAGRRRVWLGGGWRRVPFFRRRELGAGDRLAGPALVFEAHSATVVLAGWRLRVDGAGALVLERGADDPAERLSEEVPWPFA